MTGIDLKSVRTMDGLVEVAGEAVRRSGWQLGMSDDALYRAILEAVVEELNVPLSPGRPPACKKQDVKEALLSRVANLKSTNHVERGLPNEISHNQGWQGALELVEDAIKEICE